jgi:hypothetical protein
MPTTGAVRTRATVVSSNVNPGSRAAHTERYDVELDVLVSGASPRRVQLVDIALGPMLPIIGSTVAVIVSPSGDVEILWRGDPNLDLDAHRRELADMAEAVRLRRESSR